MPSSTSNSDIHLTRRWVPEGRWLLSLGTALMLGILTVVGLEMWLASRGFEPTIVDTPALWAAQRARVDRLGDRALVLVGASRMQLDVDLDTLRDLSGKEPVQLAVDGSSFVPVLADLAEDENVTGTILVDYQDHVVGDFDRKDGATAYVAEWQHERRRGTTTDFATVEALLTAFVRHHLRSFADGASPFDSLMRRALDADATPQYLVTLPDRQRLADYSRVAMPQFYFARVMRNAGIQSAPVAPDWKTLNMMLTKQFDALTPAVMPEFAANSERIASMVNRIQSRGGHVIFMVFPRSGLVRMTDDRRFPRQVYWQTFIDTVRAPSLHYADVPAMSVLVCPDGSHLDRRDRVAFTRDLVHAMPLLSGDKADIVPRTARSVPPPNPSEHAL